jgi:hypothetical protein
MTTNVLKHFNLGFGAFSTYGIRLDIMIEQLIGVEFRTIRRQQKQANPLSMSL